MKYLTAGLMAGLLTATTAMADDTLPAGSYEVAFAGCGWYVVLGCGTSFDGARATMNNLGGPMAGGGAGLKVANTSEYPNFRNGFFCVVDGPYSSQGAAQSVAWNEAVRDAYVKNGC